MEILEVNDNSLNFDKIRYNYKTWIKLYIEQGFNVDDSEIINNYKYCIINNNNLVALLNIYKENEYATVNIIISNENNYWYEIIRNIRIFCKDKKYIKILFLYIHNHAIIKNIIKVFDGFNIGVHYILPLYKYEYKFNEKLTIKIILYKNPSKTLILFMHKSNIIITKNIIKSKYPYFNMLNIFRNKYVYSKLNKIKHKFYSLNLIFENKLELTEELANNTTDIWIDLYINYNNKKINLIVGKDPYDVRLNKLNDISINDYLISYIFSIYSIKYNCECNTCNNIEKNNNPYYFNNETSKKLYEFIDNNFNELILYIKPTFYDKFQKNLDTDYNLPSLFENENNFEDSIKNECSYIYLIEKYDVNEKHTIFKFGKTNRNINKRLNEHGRECKPLLILNVNNCSAIEKKILKILSNDKNIKHLKRMGTEYFYCENKAYIIKKIIKNIYN